MIYVLLYQIFVIWLAYKNASWSNPEEKHKIKHWLNGLFHVTAAGLVFVFTSEWVLGVSLLLITRVVFDTSYNLFMKNGLGYVSPAPASKLDRAEKWLVLKIASMLYSNKIIIPEYFVERIAIVIRVKILLTGIILLL